MKITSLEFIKAAVLASQYPPATMPEIAFVGRSNVGKSSLINIWSAQKSPKTSNTPGRTSLLISSPLTKPYRSSICPGYGFAKVSSL